MSTAFSSIVGAVIAALQAYPPVCPAIYRARPDQIPEQIDRAVSVQWESGLPSLGAIRGAPVDWMTKVTVECYARGTQDSGDVIVDPLLQDVYARLGQDTTLGGLIDDLNIAGVEAENTAAGKKSGWVRLTYIAIHRTENGTLD